MPSPPEGWAWWVFTVIIAASIVSLVNNLASNRLQKFLDNHFESRRRKRLEDDQFRAEYVEMMVKLAEEDSTVLTVMANLYGVWQRRSTRHFQLGLLALGTGAVMSIAAVYEPGRTSVPFMMGALSLGLLGLLFISTAAKTGIKGGIYGDVIYAYHQKHHIDKLIAREEARKATGRADALDDAPR